MHDIGLALDTIDRGLLDDNGAATGQFYTVKTNNQSKERWAGKVLTRMLGCTDAAAKNLIRNWLKEDILVEFDYTDPSTAQASLRGKNGAEKQARCCSASCRYLKTKKCASWKWTGATLAQNLAPVTKVH